ncbi:unnamed protein product [Moneuplotes crassus]|uniref:Uncharacterized protein n=1 Tax=Euplotes crassus TaxID=5936 RepID=A0AAD1XES0_EUPCR|nr:unnamed protein product [Moneuplotes crassus]
MEPSISSSDEQRKLLSEEGKRKDFIETRIDFIHDSCEKILKRGYIKYDCSNIYNKYNKLRKPSDRLNRMCVVFHKNSTWSLKKSLKHFIRYPLEELVICGSSKFRNEKISRLLPKMIKILPDVTAECVFNNLLLSEKDLLHIFCNLTSGCQLRFGNCRLAQIRKRDLYREPSISKLFLYRCYSFDEMLFDLENSSFISLVQLISDSSSNFGLSEIRIEPNFTTDDITKLKERIDLGEIKFDIG